MSEYTARVVVGAASMIFIFLLIHCFTLHYTFRSVLICFDKYGLNRHSNAQAADVYRGKYVGQKSCLEEYNEADYFEPLRYAAYIEYLWDKRGMTFYTIRCLLNVLDVFADVNALTALLMIEVAAYYAKNLAPTSLQKCGPRRYAGHTFVNGVIRSRSRCLLVRCCCDVRDSMAMYLGGSVVLTILSCICRKVEIFVLTMTPYDTIECCGIKGVLYLRGRLDNPEYSANAVSRYVGFSIIDCLMSGFKGVLMMRLFEYYDDLCQLIDIVALIYKRQQQAIAMAAIKRDASFETPKYTSTTA